MLGDCGVDLVRMRVGVAVFTEGLEGDVGRKRDAGGASDLGFEGVRADGDCGMRDIIYLKEVKQSRVKQPCHC